MQAVTELRFLGMSETGLVWRSGRWGAVDTSDGERMLPYHKTKQRQQQVNLPVSHGFCASRGFAASFFASGKYSIKTFFFPFIYLFNTSLIWLVVTAWYFAKSVLM